MIYCRSVFVNIYIYIYNIYNIYMYYIYIYISEYKQNAHNNGNRAQPLKRLLETLFLAIKKCTGFLKATLKTEFCFHRYVHFACTPIYMFGLHHKQCASDLKDFTFVKFTTQLLVALMSPLRTTQNSITMLF